MSRFLVTGASGFIGRQLCGELLRRGNRVRAAVRAPCRLPEGVEQVTVGSMDEATYWSAALRDIDIVFHLAAKIDAAKDHAADPLAEFLKVNLLGTANLAQQAAAAGIRRLVYVSSIKVNGEQTRNGQSFSEQDMAAPRDPYGISKWQAEQALRHIARMTGLQVVIVRPPLVYGPGVKGNFFRLMAAIDRGVPLPLAGAHNLRSMMYAGNLVDALIACASHPAAAGRTYLVSDGEDVTTAKLAEDIARALGRGSRSFYFPPGLLHALAIVLGRKEQADRLFASLQVSNQKIRGDLGWAPPYSMEQGLCATADWYRTQRNGYNHGTP
ncbi:MAG: SDR family oxidoreductase [Gallionella sp.]